MRATGPVLSLICLLFASGPAWGEETPDDAVMAEPDPGMAEPDPDGQNESPCDPWPTCAFDNSGFRPGAPTVGIKQDTLDSRDLNASEIFSRDFDSLRLQSQPAGNLQ